MNRPVIPASRYETRLHAAQAELPAEDASVQLALDSSHELKRLQSQVAARGLEIRGQLRRLAADASAAGHV